MGTGGQKCCKNLDVFRNTVQGFVDRHDFETARFWADKLVSISGGSQQDVYLLAKCTYLSGQHHRASGLIMFYQYERCNLSFRCLTAKCLFKAREFQKALEILDLENRSVYPGQKLKPSVWEPPDNPKSVMAQIYLLRGKIHEALMNRIVAAQNYKSALSSDIYCFEAFDLLTQNQMLSKAEEVELLQSLNFSKVCTNADGEFVKFLYTSKLKKYSSAESVTTPVFPVLKKNLDLLTCEAERLYYNCDFQAAFKLSSEIIRDDPYHIYCLPVFIACLVELNKITELFKISHRLVDVMSDYAVSWYAVGAYYFITGKQDNARRYLNKSISLNPVFGPAWLLYGHSFASENEHDQAMAAYFKATQLMKGCHLPLLHVGMECGLSNNPQLAMKFLEESKQLAPQDPFIRHEMGVVRFNEKKWDEAHSLFMETLNLLEMPSYSVAFKKWEPLYNNLGHVLRKLLKYQIALEYHRKALVICPSNASTYSSMGLLYAIMGKTESAIEYFHKALSIRRDDACSNAMLRYCVEKAVEECKDDDTNVIAWMEEDEEKDNAKPTRTLRSGKSKHNNESLLLEELPDVKRVRTPRGKDKDKAESEAPGQLKFFKSSLSDKLSRVSIEKRGSGSSSAASDVGSSNATTPTGTGPTSGSTPAATPETSRAVNLPPPPISATTTEMNLRRRPKRELRSSATNSPSGNNTSLNISIGSGDSDRSATLTASSGDNDSD